MSSMSVWRVDSADASFAALRMHDLRVSLVEGSTAREGALRSALARSGAARRRRGGRRAARRLDAGRRLHAAGARSSSRAGSSARRRARTSTRSTSRARPPAAPTARPSRSSTTSPATTTCPPPGALTLAGGQRVRYTGQALAPEYFIVTAPGADFGAESAFAVVFAPLRTAQALAGEPGRSTSWSCACGPAPTRPPCRRSSARALRAGAAATPASRSPRATQEPAHRLIYKDAEGDQEMLDIFAFLLLGAATFAAFNLDQPHRRGAAARDRHRHGARRRAAGARPPPVPARRARSRSPASRSGSRSGSPPTPGWPASWTSSSRCRSSAPSFQSDLYVQGAALGLALPLLAAAVPVWRALRVTPIEAIRVGARAARSSGLAWLAKGLRLPGGSLANLPLRNVLRTPRRTADDRCSASARSSRSLSRSRA